ncbi:MAG: putative quinol monooxygenase [Candidatus Heimdallarchaeota archaeon]
MIHRVARFEVSKDEIIEAISVITEFVEKVNTEEPNCILYRSLQEKESETKFTHYMIFSNKEAEEYHRQTPWVKSFVSKLYPILEVVPVFTEMKVIGSG